MAFTASAMFRALPADMLANTAPFDLDTDVPKAALYGNTGTPDKDVAAALTAYNTGQWVTANEVFHAGQWSQGGVALSGTSLNVGTSGVVFYDAADTQSGSAATLSSVYGTEVYDDTLTTPVADQGLCFNYFGGVQAVTLGTFTIIWNALGILRFTV